MLLSLRLRSTDGGRGAGTRLLIGCLAPFVVFALLLLIVFVGDWPPIEALGAALGRLDPGFAHWAPIVFSVAFAWTPAVLAARRIIQLRRARKLAAAG